MTNDCTTRSQRVLFVGVTGPHPNPTHTTRDLAFFALAALLLLPSVWSPCSITGQDEYYLSFRTVLEMQERGEWLTPYVNGAVRLQKPPLLYWLMRASFLAFGSNLFAARVWAVLFGAGMALFTAKLARRYRGGGSGYLAGAFVLGAAGVMIDARRAMFDLPVGCLCTAAVYFSVTWHADGRLRRALLAGGLLAAASMTKGPVALWFYAAPLLAAACVRRGRANGPWWHWLVASAAFFALALPWPLWAQSAHPEFWDVMQAQAEQREFGLPPAERPLKLLAAAIGLIVPWSVAVLAALLNALRGKSPSDSPARWLTLWVLIGLLPFLFMKTFERYMIALVCPMATLCALWLARCSDRTMRAHATIATCLAGLPVVVFALFAAWFGLAYVAPLATLGLLLMTWKVARRDRPDLPLAATMTAALLSALLGLVYPSLGINALPPDLPKELQTAEVRTFARPQPGMLSIALGRSVQEFDGRDTRLAERLAAYDGFLFVLDRDVARVERAARDRGVPVERVLEFRSFYSRKAWLKFFKEGAHWAEWQAALLERSPEPLKPRFVCLRIG